MNIGINARVLNERKGGPYRYTVNVIRELSHIDKKNTYFIFLYDDYQFNFKLPSNFKKVVFKIKSKIVFDYIILLLYSYFHHIDIWLFPKNTFSPFIRGKNIPVFHDIVYFEKELNFREFNYFDNLHHRIMIPINAKCAAMNIAVSEFTALRMKELLNIPQNKIKIIKEGVEENFKRIDSLDYLQSVIAKYNLKLPFFFYAGSLSPRKNMLNVLKAFNLIKDEIPHTIYYTGGYSWRDNEVLQYITDNNLEKRVIKLGYVSDEELVALYNLADCYLYPSIYEGFGLPILEAQACGCPVITSTVSSCPEVAGNAALLVNPYDVSQIAEAMLRMAKDKKLKKQLQEKGFKNVGKYSWHFCARTMLQLFEDIHTKG